MAAKDWVFTLNNYEEEQYKALCDEMREVCNYFVMGKEKGEKGTPHLQGFFQLKKKQNLKRLKQTFGRGLHFEKRKGTPSQAAEYCKKEGSFLEEGTLQGQGQRTDLQSIRCSVQEGAGMKKIIEGGATFQQIRYAEKVLGYLCPVRDWEPQVWWFHGKTGLGKSRAARLVCPKPRYVKNESSKWWQGYDGEENVILDDFDDTWMTYQEILSLLDRYERVVECKGGSRQFLGRRVVLTSQHPPQVYYGAKGDLDQLLRRVHTIVEFTREDQWRDWEDNPEPQPPTPAEDSGDETSEETLRSRGEGQQKKKQKIDVIDLD